MSNETNKQRQERLKNERIGLAMQKLKQAENNKDIGLWVTHDGFDLLTNMLSNSIKRMVKEAITESVKELLEGAASGLITNMLKGVTEDIEQQIQPLNEGKVEEAEEQIVIERLAVVEAIKPQAQHQEKVKQVRKPWTNEEDLELIQLMENKPEATKALYEAAEKLNRPFTSVRTRYYAKLKKQK